MWVCLKAHLVFDRKTVEMTKFKEAEKKTEEVVN